MQAEQRLVQKIASRASTEELIFFIAQDEAITSACSELQKKIARNNNKELKTIHALCQRYHISLVYLSRELNHIQNIFAPRETTSDDHKLLGLQAGASIAEVKQAYRRLSIKYHPDTSNKNSTAKFIEITKAYQRITNIADKEENSAPPSSSSAWRYRKNTSPPPQQRKKQYLYLFSVVTGAVVLIIVAFSIHYQKRAMLKNISMVTSTRSPISSPAEDTPAIVKEHLAETHVPEVPESSTPAVQPQVTEQKQHPLPTSKILEQSFHQFSQNEVALVTPTPESMNHVQSPAPVMQTEAEVENLSTSISFSDSHFDSEKSSTEKTDQMEPKPILPVEKQSNLFSDILEQEKTAEKKIKAVAPGAVQQTSKQKETSSLFSQARYQKVVLIKPKERKIRKKKLPAADEKQVHQGIPVLDSLHTFIKSYTAAYMSKDIQQFALFFTEDSLENDKPFKKMHAKYKQLFNATQSIDYRIDLLGTDIQDEGATATLTGRFRVQLIFSPYNVKSNSGTITFYLIKIKNSYRIKVLSYHLDPKKK